MENQQPNIKKLEIERDKAWSMVYAAQKIALRKEQELQRAIEAMTSKAIYNPYGRE